MKKTLQRLGIVTVGLSLCLWSCKEQDGLVKPSEEVTSTFSKIKEKIDFSVVEGRLKFETNDDFSSAIAQASSPKGAKTWEDVSGFTSLGEAYSKYVIENAEKAIGEVNKDYDDAVFILTDNEGKKSYERTVTMPSLVALINQKGIVQIGDKILKISDEEVRITTLSFKSELELVSPSNHVKINKVTHGKLNEKSAKGAKVNSEYNRHSSKEYSGIGGFSKRRVLYHKFATLYNIGYTFLWSIGCHMIHQRSNWNGWGNENVDNWSFDAGYAYINPNFPLAPYVTGTTFYYNQSSLNWSGNPNAPGVADFWLYVDGQFNPPNSPNSPYYSLNMGFNPGIISAYTAGPGSVSINDLNFDTTLPVWSNASI